MITYIKQFLYIRLPSLLLLMLLLLNLFFSFLCIFSVWKHAGELQQPGARILMYRGIE